MIIISEKAIFGSGKAGDIAKYGLMEGSIMEWCPSCHRILTDGGDCIDCTNRTRTGS